MKRAVIAVCARILAILSACLVVLAGVILITASAVEMAIDHLAGRDY
jgi:hypothetical protein